MCSRSTAEGSASRPPQPPAYPILRFFLTTRTKATPFSPNPHPTPVPLGRPRFQPWLSPTPHTPELQPPGQISPPTHNSSPATSSAAGRARVHAPQSSANRVIQRDPSKTSTRGTSTKNRRTAGGVGNRPPGTPQLRVNMADRSASKRSTSWTVPISLRDVNHAVIMVGTCQTQR